MHLHTHHTDDIMMGDLSFSFSQQSDNWFCSSVWDCDLSGHLHHHPAHHRPLPSPQQRSLLGRCYFFLASICPLKRCISPSAETLSQSPSKSSTSCCLPLEVPVQGLAWSRDYWWFAIIQKHCLQKAECQKQLVQNVVALKNLPHNLNIYYRW